MRLLVAAPDRLEHRRFRDLPVRARARRPARRQHQRDRARGADGASSAARWRRCTSPPGWTRRPGSWRSGGPATTGPSSTSRPAPGSRCPAGRRRRCSARSPPRRRPASGCGSPRSRAFRTASRTCAGTAGRSPTATSARPSLSRTGSPCSPGIRAARRCRARDGRSPSGSSSTSSRGESPCAPVVLHCGVSSPELSEPPAPERYAVPPSTARLVNAVSSAGGRVVAVGHHRRPCPGDLRVPGRDRSRPATAGRTSCSGRPDPPEWSTGLVTGLHEPQASHLLLLEAVAGRALVDEAYAAVTAGRSAVPVARVRRRHAPAALSSLRPTRGRDQLGEAARAPRAPRRRRGRGSRARRRRRAELRSAGRGPRRCRSRHGTRPRAPGAAPGRAPSGTMRIVERCVTSTPPGSRPASAQ